MALFRLWPRMYSISMNAASRPIRRRGPPRRGVREPGHDPRFAFEAGLGLGVESDPRDDQLGARSVSSSRCLTSQTVPIPFAQEFSAR